MNCRVLAIVQARSTSERFPKKVIASLFGKPMILHLFDRLKKAKFVDRIILATSDDSSDDELAHVCESNQIPVFRGSLDNVLDRFYNAAQLSCPEVVVRITGDCPAIDPVLLDDMLNEFTKASVDYLSNTNPPTFPDGLDIEIFNFKTLKTTWENAETAFEKEHVTPYIHSHNDLFIISNFAAEEDFSKWRLTVDYLSDLKVMEKLFQELCPKNPIFGYKEMIQYLVDHPDVVEMNSGIQRNEKMADPEGK